MTEHRTNPYVGPRPFTTEDAGRFFGRDGEAAEILSLILAYPAVVLYSESGAGKTSLLNARIIPGLRERECDVIGPVRVSAEFGEGFTSKPGTNVYTLSSLLLMDRDNNDVTSLSRLSLRDYLAQRSRPVTQHAIRPPRVVIFDQFEELFTTRPERWEDRARFMHDVGEALDDDPRLRVVFALREEFIASIDALAYELPDGLRTRLRLERLRRTPALEAIEKPLQETGVSFAPGIADLLLDNLLRIPALEGTAARDEFVEPVHLQLVCHRVWDSLDDETSTIQAKDVETYGNVDSALASYYDSCIQRVAEQTGRSEAQLRVWFQKNFITSDATRGLVYRTIQHTGGLPSDIADRFQALYLIRAETRGGSRWFELAHDRLIAPILESNRSFRQKHDEGSLSLELLDARADKWRQGNRDADMLLRGEEIAAARERLLNEDETFAVSDSLREFLDASDIARDRRHLRRLRQQLFAGVAAVLLLAAVALHAWWLIRQRDEARSQERETVARRMIDFEPMEIDGLMWALRAYAGSKQPERYNKIIRTALDRVGPTLWLRRDAPIQNALFSPSGKQIITIAENELCVWDADTGTFQAKLDAPPNRIWREAFFSRSSRFVMAHSVPDPAERKKQFTAESNMAAKEFTIWEWKNRRILPQLAKIPRHEDISVSPNDATLAIAYEPIPNGQSFRRGARRIKLYDLEADRELRSIRTEQAVSFISLSPKATRLMTVEDDKVRIWETSTGRKIGEIPQPLFVENYAQIRWSGEDTLFVGFLSASSFAPTLVHIRRGRLETTPLPIPQRVLDAWFGEDGRLLVKADTASSNGRTIRAYLFDQRGILREELEPERLGESYRGYARYFKTGNVVTIKSEKASKSASAGCSYRVGAAKNVLVPNLKFQDLTSLSTSSDRLLTVANGVAKIWDVDRAAELKSIPTDQLVTFACSRFSNQPQLRSTLADEKVCVENDRLTMRAGM